MKKAIFAIVGLALVAVLASRIADDSREPASDGVRWTGEQDLPRDSPEVGMIEIPGVKDLLFDTSTVQKVNIYNPESNRCSIVFTLTVGDKILWKSEECQPGFGFYEIELAEALSPGTYKANLLHECYRDGNKLNSANIEINLKVKEKTL